MNSSPSYFTIRIKTEKLKYLLHILELFMEHGVLNCDKHVDKSYDQANKD